MSSAKIRVFVLVLFGWLLLGWNLAQDIEQVLRPRVGSAANFNLPDASICGGYNLTHARLEYVVIVYNATYRNIGSKYANRSILTLLSNGTLSFTLHHIQYSDEGTYLVQPGGRSPDICWRKYQLSVIKEDPSNAYWLPWESWSSCDKTCGTATRVRSRDCSIPTSCNQGDDLERETCDGNKPCETQSFVWSDWSGWSECSQTCGAGRYDRQRYCLSDQLRRANIEHCIGDSYENKECFLKHCQIVREPTAVYQWMDWESWSTCSASCGPGFQTRERKCRDRFTEVDENRCTGFSTENITCSVIKCNIDQDQSAGNGNLKADDQTVKLPLSGIVGTGAGLFIVILAVVICVLIVKLKRKRKMVRVVKTGSVRRNSSIGRNEDSVFSCSSFGVSGVHVYDEIDQRMSVLTIDNPYVTMPKSASPRGNPDTINNTVTYSNTQETVFVFDSSTEAGQVIGTDKRKVSNAYQNTSDPETKNNLTVPRHLSIDSSGYLMPGNANERAARRNKKYLKNT